MQTLFKIYLLGISLISFSAQAQQSCFGLFAAQPSNFQEPLLQLRIWEQQANLPEMRKPAGTVLVAQSLVSENQIATRTLEGHEELGDHFQRDGSLLWPQHPLNTASIVPFFTEPVHETFSAFYSASRSLFFFKDEDFYSIKMPTNRPHPESEPQTSKAVLGHVLDSAIERSHHIQAQDQIFGAHPQLQVLFDVLSVKDKESSNGFVVRDLRPLQDGNYYLPGFSIPFAGWDIASAVSPEMSFEQFWGTHYAAAVGRAKALLLLRYGLIMTSPNTQNLLVQLDRNWRPTGKIMIRDISDSRFFEPLAVALGYEAEVQHDKGRGVEVYNNLQTETSTSFWRMRDADIPRSTIYNWEQMHDQAFTATIVEILKLNPDNYKSIGDLFQFFATERGLKSLRDFSTSKSHPTVAL